MRKDSSVLVDSSVWIHFLKGLPQVQKPIQELMQSGRIVICGVIKQELLQGARDAQHFEKLNRLFSEWNYAAEKPEDYIEAARLYSKLRTQGITIPASDCLAATVALRRKFSFYAMDTHFDFVPDLMRFEL